MNLAVDQGRFRRELAGWTARVILCALPSALTAGLEYNRPFELAAMATGVALYIGGTAWFCAWEAMQATPGRERFVRSLKMAAWLKIAVLLLAGAGLGVAAGFHVNAAACVMVGLLPDFYAGIGSLWIVSVFAGNGDFAQLHGFGWIFAATIMEGAVISAGLALVAAGLCGGHRALAWLTGQRTSPDRIWG